MVWPKPFGWLHLSVVLLDMDYGLLVGSVSMLIVLIKDQFNVQLVGISNS